MLDAFVNHILYFFKKKQKALIKHDKLIRLDQTIASNSQLFSQAYLGQSIQA